MAIILMYKILEKVRFALQSRKFKYVHKKKAKHENKLT